MNWSLVRSNSYWDIKTDAVKLTLFLRGAFFSFAGITSPASLRDCPATCSQPEPRLTTSGKRWRRQPTAWRSVGSVSHDWNSLGMQVLLNQRLLIPYKYNCRNEPTFELTVTAAVRLLQLSEPLAFISPPGSVVSRHVQFCGQRNRLCKLLPDGERHVSPDWDCYWMATQISCLFAENLCVCVCLPQLIEVQAEYHRKSLELLQSVLPQIKAHQGEFESIVHVSHCDSSHQMNHQ